MRKRPSTNDEKTTRKFDPVVITLIGTIITALLASPVLIELIRNIQTPTPTPSVQTPTPVLSVSTETATVTIFVTPLPITQWEMDEKAKALQEITAEAIGTDIGSATSEMHCYYEYSTITNTKCFQDFPNDASIFWMRSNGAHVINGLILKKWRKLYGVLGYPKDDIQQTGCNGHFAEFEGGAIYLKANSSDAYAVENEILRKWKHINKNAPCGDAGYPITDTSITSGKYTVNDFENSYYSIFWRRDRGAYEVHGAISKKWLEQYRENGPLGVPITDEKPYPLLGKTGRRSDFEHGSICYTYEKGAQDCP